MVRERLQQAGVRFEPTITLSGVATMFGVVVTLLGAIGGYFVLQWRVGAIEAAVTKTADDHTTIAVIQADVRWIRDSLTKRADGSTPPVRQTKSVTDIPSFQ